MPRGTEEPLVLAGGAAVILTTAAFGLLFVAASGALAPSTFEGNDGT